MKKFVFPIIAGTFATLTIGILAYLGSATNSVLWLMAPFGATVVLVFGVPKSPLAQPKNVILGHLLTAFIGVLFVEYIGVEPWSLAIATGLAVTIMLLTNTTHPPAGANPMVIMLSGQSWAFLFNPVLIGACVIVGLGFILNKLRTSCFERIE
ncbi:HPP family protein [Moritella viscosa]|uniref:HPP family protein n=2 Tax=Moritella viscosa TaxID=80854 RepID=A0A1L0CFB8_9GAMM|nr:HPP family protein [Moritella viscosa]SGZ20525.1 HPP family protein [Moritella viscosa]SHO04046.1 HPP family protein [Moritella viscosa]